MTKSIIGFQVILIIVICCSLQVPTMAKELEQNDTISYFDFDEVIHYHIEIDGDTVYEMKLNYQELFDSKKLLFDLVKAQKPAFLEDTLFLDTLGALGYTRTKIDSIKLDSINDIFSGKDVDEIFDMMCIPVFRDLLVFRKDGEIVGLASICFTCYKNRIFGTSANTITFGQDGDYSRLEAILFSD